MMPQLLCGFGLFSFIINLIAGDMNTIKESKPYQLLKQCGYEDTWSIAPKKDDGGCCGDTYHGWAPHLRESHIRAENDCLPCIDWIMYRNIPRSEYRISVRQANVITDRWIGGADTRFPSDHFPISTTFTLKK